MASSINSTSTGSGGLISTGDDSGILNIQTNETTAITVDASQRVGIGTTSPNSKLQVGTGAAASTVQAQILGGVTVFENSGATTTVPTITFNNDLDTGINNPGANLLAFYTAGAERMRIDSSGNLLLGTTSVAGTSTFDIVRPANTATYIYMLKNTQLEMTMGAKASTDTNFYIGSGSSTIGQNGVYLTAAGNSWNAVSDERQKNIIESIDNGLEKVSALRAVIGSYKHDPKEIRRPFLIAQDVQAVLPEAVNIQDEETGTLGMSYTDVIPLLVASIKELKAINDTQAETINALTARIVLLETK